MVAGWTKLRTENGDIEVRELAGKEVKVWNGQVFAPVTPRLFTNKRNTVILTFDDNTMLFCTPSQWLKLRDGSMETAVRVTPGTGLIFWANENGQSVTAEVKEVTTGPSIDVYDIREPLQKAVVCNGILLPMHPVKE